MQEPSSVILPDGTVVTEHTDTHTLLNIRAQIIKKRWSSWQDIDAGTDAANIVLYRWECRKHGSHPDWNFEEPGRGLPIQLKEARLNRVSVDDERGLLCIFDPDAYCDHTSDRFWGEFIENLLEQVSLQRALVCDLGHGGNWDTEIATKPVKSRSFRSATIPIISSKGRLTICGAENLYNFDPEIPHMFMIGLEFDVSPGSYDCSILQLRPPDYLEPEYENWLETRDPNDPEVLIQLRPGT